ncbi:hypothetical protein CVT24_012006 [Panaeolus cyanescens]|uniref:Uncharacterized protein n=1 Tax=Panaeolus cyanescens TaxID=181874 RepID=A0A409VHQ8_9AGAR|nr:hypothetical protein CVT24_012006 [Panaeolus cyanescens]
MILRGLQLTTTSEQQHRPTVAPSLLQDPAFSPDPHSNPYFVTSHEPDWLFPPPGHPVLKNKNRFINSIQTDHDQGDTITTHQQLIQPPNSPATVSDPHENPHFPFKLEATATSSLTPIKRNPISFQHTEGILTLQPQRSITPPLLLQPAATAPNPSHKFPKFNKRFMPFLSRRKSAKPQEPSASQSITAKLSKPTANHLTQGPSGTTSHSLSSAQKHHLISNTAGAQQAGPVGATIPPTLPIPHDELRAGESSRSENTAATSLPTTSRKSSVTGSTASKRLPNGLGVRPADLDRIDELDDSNLWGVSLHHGGPYEAAVKAIRRGAGDKRMPLGLPGNSSFHEYHRRAMEAHGNVYVPPRAPVGVSLKLSPGQILPRNFSAPEGMVFGRPRRENPPQPVMMMRPKPPTTMVAEPSIMAFSPPPPSQTPPPAPQPQHIPHIVVVPQTPSQPISQPQQPRVLEVDRLPDAPIDDTARIGMAMFAEDPEPSPRSATHHGDEYDPYDPIHLEVTHSTSRTPSPSINMTSVPVPTSRVLTPEMAQEVAVGPDASTSDLTLIGSTDERSHPPTPAGPAHISLAEPPPYSNATDARVPADHFQSPAMTQTPYPPQRQILDQNPVPASLMPGMGRQPAIPILIQPFEANQRPNDQPRVSLERRPAETSNRMHPPPRDASTTPPQQRHRDAYPQRPQPIPQLAYEETREQPSTAPARPMPRELHTQYTPLVRDGQAGVLNNRGPPAAAFDVDRDARSTHPSISTQASSMQRYAPPRHQPRQLVMPTPLNTNRAGQHGGNQVPPPATFVRGHYQQRSRQLTVPAPLAQHGAAPMRPIAVPVTPITPRAQELQMNSGKGGKLKKRASLFGSSKPPPQPVQKAPVLTTVSFAPPIIAFERGRGDEKMLLRANTERLPPTSGPKRFLSKRQSNV